MPVDVQSEIVIHAARTRVAEFAADPDNAPLWYGNIKSVEWKTPKPLAVGSRVAFLAEFLGRRLAYTYEVMALTPSEQLVMRTAQGPFPMQTEYTWSSSPDGATRMILRNRGNPAGFSNLAGPFLEFAMRRANRKDLALLKKILEGGN
jgi:hypothetical protein